MEKYLFSGLSCLCLAWFLYRELSYKNKEQRIARMTSKIPYVVSFVIFIFFVILGLIGLISLASEKE